VLGQVAYLPRSARDHGCGGSRSGVGAADGAATPQAPLIGSAAIETKSEHAYLCMSMRTDNALNSAMSVRSTFDPLEPMDIELVFG
jgi:hypothetical protein